MNMKILLQLIATFLLLNGCLSTQSPLVGSWVEPIPGNEEEHQGFILYDNGSAESINMATLIYKKWKVIGDKLYMTSESIGNHTSSTDTIIYDFTLAVNMNHLTLKNEGLELNFKRIQ